ncbi:GyrI-like domain-containing protein [Streptomyces bacillaris]|uniref:AraC family transcriptional regulator n=1 Tax=Streptomyces cavourensis TaxID=67258 RepID=A0AAD0Q8B5_9ACTN|nr:AraC family transcriptional regulator [Streptomyces cavourensis]AXI74218.1 AraC family transcriptional regulator [Streptomyces cavourensis]MBH0242295.1 AraC family transcriptional regulator [Streptomyces cavourensis]TQO33153.1 AraC family transcriptional regulator [Streptomyces cavourensis]WAE68822.1 AraC family transcriptional regulator [Streptomyces cavourensis]GGU92491.1 AraC family transcriptional regulator [Streptomyces cavourensis]
MLERLNEAMEYIESHLGERIEVADLARTATTSEYHFRRMFSALAGVPLAEYIRRRRMTVAGAEVLGHPDRTILEVAVRYGYDTGEGFARAFRAVHGIGPGEARRTGAVLRSQQRLTFRLVVEGSSAMNYRLVEKGEFRVVGRRARVPLIHEGPNPAIAEFIRSIGREELERIAALSDQEPAGLVGVSDQLDPSRAEGTELDYYHGVVRGPEPSDEGAEEGLDSLPVPAGTWAVFTNDGEFPQALQYLWRDVFTQWFPSNPYASRPGPEILSVRLYEEGRRAAAELWIPVERAERPEREPGR